MENGQNGTSKPVQIHMIWFTHIITKIEQYLHHLGIINKTRLPEVNLYHIKVFILVLAEIKINRNKWKKYKPKYLFQTVRLFHSLLISSGMFLTYRAMVHYNINKIQLDLPQNFIKNLGSISAYWIIF